MHKGRGTRRVLLLFLPKSMKNRILFFILTCLSGSLCLKAQQAYTIYPIPQEQIIGDETPWWDGGKYEVVCESGVDRATRVRLIEILLASGASLPGWNPSEDMDVLVENLPTAPSGTKWPVIYLGINGSNQAADKKASEKGLKRDVFELQDKYDRHLLSISNSGDEYNSADIVVLGEHTDAVFHALASLEQILEQRTSAETIQSVTLYDYADQQSRGLVEGYYGYPYTIEVKKDLMRFMMRYKMNTYLYGAKSDPYHSQYWKDAYPTTLTNEQIKNGWLSQEMVKEISKVSQETKVNFIWAIHPGNDFTNSSTVINDIMSKFSKMYNLGVRQFAVFVDDVSVPEDAVTHQLNANRVTELQRAIENKWNTDGVAAADTVKPIHFVPQVYASSFVAENVRKSFFKALSSTPKNVVIYTTGWGVWSVPNSSDLRVVKDDLGRDVAWWWNYPCNDNADGQLYTMDMYSNFYDMPSVNSNAMLPAALLDGLGIVSNPMQEGELSKVPLFSVADYAWNNSTFRNIDSWNAACEAVVGKEAAPAYKLLAKYLRYNDPAELNSIINSYKTSLRLGSPNPTKLREEISAIAAACNEMVVFEHSERLSDRLFYNDLKPWLLKLQQMVRSLDALLTVASMDNAEDEKWNLYVPQITNIKDLETTETYKAYALEGMGSWISVSERPSQPSELYLYPFVKYMVENALGDYFPEVVTKPKKLTNMPTSKGNPSVLKNEVGFSNATNTLQPNEYIGFSMAQPVKPADIVLADTLLTHFVVLYSEDGKQWSEYIDRETALQNHIKHIVVLNPTKEAATLRLTRGVLSVKLPMPTEIAAVTIPSGNVWDGHTADYMYDGNYSTFVCLNRNQQSGDAYVVKLTGSEMVEDVRICMGTVNDDYMTEGVVEVSVDGKTWRTLKVKGTNSTVFKMSIPQVVKYSDEMAYCDFQGDGKEAQYVRLYLKVPNTSKWLRLYEIEVNRSAYEAKYKSSVEDGKHNPITTLTDALGYTDGTGANESLTYYFRSPHYLQSLDIYQGEAPHSAQLEITEDENVWHTLGQLKGGKQHVDLSQYPLARALRISWKGDAPIIYEMVEAIDENRRVEITGVAPISLQKDAPILVCRNGNWCVECASGIQQVSVFTSDGRLLSSLRSVGKTLVPLTLVRTFNGVLVVKVVSESGAESTYKLCSD